MKLDNNSICDCSEDYGPCETHSELLVGREGANTRTGDELALQLIEDCLELGAEISRTGQLDLESLEWDGRWLKDGDDSEFMRDLASQIENDLYSVDRRVDGEIVEGQWWVIREGGYRIYFITDGPLVED